MTYVTGFLLPVPDEKKESYRAMAEKAATVFRENGALQVVEAWGAEVPEGETTSFPMAVKLEKGETVVFSWITWPDGATAKAGMEKAMVDPRLKFDPSDLPFDGRRMMWGGFETILEA